MVELDELELELGREVIELASSLSIAAMVDPALLRIVRRTLHPKLTHEAEAVVFHSSLAESQGRHGFVLTERHLAELRWRLIDGGRLEDARLVLQSVHEGLPALVRLEEELTYELLAAQNPVAVERLLGSVVAWLRDSTDRRPVGRWILRAFRRAPEELWETPFATQAFSLVHAAGAVLGGVAFGHRAVNSQAARVLPVLDDRSMQVGARLGPTGLVFSGRPDGPTTIDVPAAWPVVLGINADSHARRTVTLHDSASMVEISVELPATVSTITGRRFSLSQEASSTIQLPAPLDAVAWSADPAMVVAASRRSRQLMRLSPETTELVDSYPLSDLPLERLVLARTGKRAAGSSEAGVMVWDTAGPSPLARFDNRGRLHALCIDGNGEAIAAASDAGTVVWSIRDGPLAELRAGPGPLALSTAGDALAMVTQDSAVEVWGLTRSIERPPVASPGQPTALAWSWDDHTVAIGDETGHVLLVDVESSSTRGGEPVHQAAVAALAFSPNGDLLASCDRAGVIHVWDLAQIRPTQTWSGHDGVITALAWSPDGSRVASAGLDGTLRTWSVLPQAIPTPTLPPLSPEQAPEATMRLTALPAAHGTALVLELGPVERPFRMVIDGGPRSSYRQGLQAWAASLPVEHRRIDVLAVTHTDEASIGGVLELLGDRSLNLTISDLWANGWSQIAEPEPL